MVQSAPYTRRATGPGGAVFPAVISKEIIVSAYTQWPMEGRVGFEPTASGCAAGVLPEALPARMVGPRPKDPKLITASRRKE